MMLDHEFPFVSGINILQDRLSLGNVDAKKGGWGLQSDFARVKGGVACSNVSMNGGRGRDSISVDDTHAGIPEHPNLTTRHPQKGKMGTMKYTVKVALPHPK